MDKHTHVSQPIHLNPTGHQKQVVVYGKHPTVVLILELPHLELNLVQLALMPQPPQHQLVALLALKHQPLVLK
jgi:hypothetical protein